MNAIARPRPEKRNVAAKTIHALAKKYGICYVETAADTLGSQITRLSDDDVELDEVELTLLALERAGHIGGVEATCLHADYLHQASQ